MTTRDELYRALTNQIRSCESEATAIECAVRGRIDAALNTADVDAIFAVAHLLGCENPENPDEKQEHRDAMAEAKRLTTVRDEMFVHETGLARRKESK